MKEPNTKLNTHIKIVTGVIADDTDDGIKHKKGAVVMRCTSDELGESISLSDDEKMILVKVSDVEKLIREARKARKNETC